MKFVIVYDNEALEGYISGWGFSCYIKGKIRVLFDTGWDGNILLHNLELAGVDDFDYIMLSHQHWDHISGLNHVIDRTSYVVVPYSFSPNLKREIARKAELIEVRNATKIADGIYSTGELGREREQSAIFETSKGLVLLTGCAHPGLDKIATKAQEFGELFAIMGGFHDFENIEELSSFDLVIPCHCTSKKQEILEMRNAKRGVAGSVFEF